MIDHGDTNFHEFFNEYPLELFTGLCSLSLYIGNWSAKTDIILSQINSLKQLTSLQIKFYCLSLDEAVGHVVDLIYSRKDDNNGSALKKLSLQSCDLTSIIILSTAMKKKRISLRHLSLELIFLHDLPKAFPYIQQIKSLQFEEVLSIDEFRATMTYQKPLVTLPQCTRLIINRMGLYTIISDLQFLFTHFPQLKHLDIEMYHNKDENDHQWELILSKYLPNLLDFRLKIEYYNNKEKFLSKLAQFQTYYQTSFWTDRHVKLSANAAGIHIYLVVEFKLKKLVSTVPLGLKCGTHISS
jgi:hypothetical protein